MKRLTTTRTTRGGNIVRWTEPTLAQRKKLGRDLLAYWRLNEYILAERLLANVFYRPIKDKALRAKANARIIAAQKDLDVIGKRIREIIDGKVIGRAKKGD